MHKFENPARMAELSPAAALLNAGLKKGDVFCDIGAGTGIFTIEAAKITGNATYAINTSTAMLEIIADKCKAQRIKNVVRLFLSAGSRRVRRCACVYCLSRNRRQDLFAERSISYSKIARQAYDHKVFL